MRHKEYTREVEGSSLSVLFIHGIAGTPDHFTDFIPLVPDNISVRNILLDGHGKGVKDFSHTSMKKWRAQVEREVDDLLSRYGKIIIVAHSMGTLFSIRQAVSRPDRIKGLFLLASPLKLFIKPAMFVNSAKLFINKKDDNDRELASIRRAYGIENDMRFWRYIGWVPRYLELFAEIKAVRGLVSSLSVPTRVYQSGKDEMVSVSSMKLLADNPYIEASVLKNSGHCYYEQSDLEALLSDFSSFLTED